MVSMVACAYHKGVGAEPPAESRGKAHGQEIKRGNASVKLKHFSFLDVQQKPQICPLF